MLNAGLYTPIYPCSLLNRPLPFSVILRFSLILFNLLQLSSGGFVTLCVTPSVRKGGWYETIGVYGLKGECACVWAMKCWYKISTVTNPILILMHALVNGSAMDLGIDLCRVPWNMTLQPQLKSVH